jgi:hypothetical protein
MIPTNCPVCHKELILDSAPLRYTCDKSDHDFAVMCKYYIFRLKIGNNKIGKSVQPTNFYFNEITIPDFDINDIYLVYLAYTNPNLKAFL